MMKKYIFPKKDIKGKVFGKLTVLSFDEYKEDSKGRRSAFWNVQCECGRIKSLKQNVLNNGQLSCGCLLHDFRKNLLPNIARNRNMKESGIASFNTLYSNYRDRAKKINVDFSLTKEEFRELSSKNCFYCSVEPLQSSHRKSYNGDYLYNGIDRLDNTKGYIAGNVVPCCEICNKAKRDMELDKFLKWIKRITEYASKISFNYKTGN